MSKNVNWCVSPRRKCPFTLTFSSAITPWMKDLSLVTTSKLSWNTDVDKISSKANKILGLIKRTCRGLNDATTLRTLYCAWVRSQLEYCTFVWSPYTARCVDKLERIQRRGTEFMLKTDNEYDTRRERLNLLSLKDRRSLFDILFFIKF